MLTHPFCARALAFALLTALSPSPSTAHEPGDPDEPPPEEAAPAPAPAEPPPEAPVTTTHYETTVSDRRARSAASSMTLRNQDLDLRPKSSPNDVLRVVPGLLAVQHQGGGKADQLFLRGFDADHGTDVGLFLDGVPINLPTHAHGQGFADLHWLIPEAIQQIDVVKGPYDVRFGDFSTAGAVNLVTRKAFDSSSVAGSLTLQPTISGRLLGGERFVAIASPDLGERLHPWIAFEAAHADGPFAAAENLRRYNLFAKISYDVTPSTSIGLFLQGYGSSWVGSGQIPSREVDAARLDPFASLDPSEGGATEREMLIAFLHHKDPAHELDASIYVTRYRLTLWNDFTYFLRDPVHGDEIEQDDSRLFAGANLAYHFHRRWRGLSFRSTLGAQLRYDGIHLELWDATSQDGNFRQRLARHADASQFHFGSNDDVDQIQLSAYAEEDVLFNKYLRAIAGLRADYFSWNVIDHDAPLGAGNPTTSGVAQRALVSPKATVVLTPLRPLDLYLNFGGGFHSNDARIAVQDGRTTPGGSVVNTVPRIWGGELGARLNLWDRVAIAAALWASYLENETVFSGDSGVFAPSDPTQRIGLDVELRARILSWLFADLDLAQAQSTSLRPSGGALALAPKIYLTGGITVKHPLGLRAGLRFRFLGDRPAFDEDSPEYKSLAPTDPRRVVAPGHLIFDLYAAYRWRFLEVSVSIQNLLNNTWREAQFGNHSCTRDEVANPLNPSYGVCGNTLAPDQRTGIADVHFTPGVPFTLDAGLKAYF